MLDLRPIEKRGLSPLGWRPLIHSMSPSLQPRKCCASVPEGSENSVPKPNEVMLAATHSAKIATILLQSPAISDTFSSRRSQQFGCRRPVLPPGENARNRHDDGTEDAE